MNITTRGNNTTALYIASDPARLTETMTESDKDIYSANYTAQYYVRTWLDIHAVVPWALLNLQAHSEPFPLD